MFPRAFSIGFELGGTRSLQGLQGPHLRSHPVLAPSPAVSKENPPKTRF